MAPPKMPTAVVVLPSSTYRASDFFAAASSLGVDLIVASENPPPIDMGDRYIQIDCSDPLSAAVSIAGLGDAVDIDGIIAVDDQGVMVAAHATELLGLRGNSPEAAAATRDKLLMRTRLAAAEVDQPLFSPLQPGDDPHEEAVIVGYPLVVKPLDRSASQGVIRVDRPEDLDGALRRVRAIVGGSSTLLLESYVPGAEVAVEGMIRRGRLDVLAIFDKPDTGSGPYFPETIFVTPSRLPPETQADVERLADSTVTSLGLGSGPVHIEMRVDDGRPRVLEAAARSIGGLCSRSLNFGLMGTSLEALILRNALDLDKTALHREPVATGVLMIPTPKSGVLRAVRGEGEVRSIDGVTGLDLTILPGQRVVAPPEGDRYLGFVYARGETPDDVEITLRKAMSILEVQLEG